jgi:hypothetical protein
MLRKRIADSASSRFMHPSLSDDISSHRSVYTETRSGKMAQMSEDRK